MLKIFAAFNVLLYFSNGYAYLYWVGESTFKPLYWVLFSIGTGFVLMVISGRLRLQNSASKRIIVWALVMILVSAISYSFTTHPEAGLQTLISWGEAALLLILFVFMFQDPAVVRYAVSMVFLTVIAAVLINYFDFIFPMEGRFSEVNGRAAGLYVNSNMSGKLLVFGMVLSVAAVPKKLRSVYCLFVFTGIVVTFSRSSMMMWAVAMFMLTWRNTFTLSRVPSTVGMGVFVIVLGASLAAGSWLGIFKATGIDSYLDENTASRIGGSFVSQDDPSSRGRRFVAKRAWELYVKSPVLGYGLGSTQGGHTQIGTHNMYLRLAIEEGLVGLVILFALLWILWRAKADVSRQIAVIYAISGIFTHNNYEQPAMMLVLALAVVGVGGVVIGTKEKSAENLYTSPHDALRPTRSLQ